MTKQTGMAYSRFRPLAKMLLLVAAVPLSGCDAISQMQTPPITEPTPQAQTASLAELQALPAPRRNVHVAVYSFEDKTGQNKPNENIADNSRALSQGGATIMVNALREAGKGSWFTVLEREQLGALLEERKLIRAARAQYADENGTPPVPLPPLLNAGILLAGGVIGYDSNITSGGYGARYLGVGGDTQYRQDNVSVYLRAVSVSNGRVIASVVANKTIFSTSVRAGVFSYVGTDRLLELEGGISANEPRHLALKKAMESAVYSLVIKGAEEGLWDFKDKAQGKALIAKYENELRFGPPQAKVETAHNEKATSS